MHVRPERLNNSPRPSKFTICALPTAPFQPSRQARATKKASVRDQLYQGGRVAPEDGHRPPNRWNVRSYNSICYCYCQHKCRQQMAMEEIYIMTLVMECFQTKANSLYNVATHPTKFLCDGGGKTRRECVCHMLTVLHATPVLAVPSGGAQRQLDHVCSDTVVCHDAFGEASSLGASCPRLPNFQNRQMSTAAIAAAAPPP